MIADQNIFFDNCLAHTIFVTVFRNSASRSRAGMVAIYIILPLRKSLLSHPRCCVFCFCKHFGFFFVCRCRCNFIFDLVGDIFLAERFYCLNNKCGLIWNLWNFFVGSTLESDDRFSVGVFFIRSVADIEPNRRNLRGKTEPIQCGIAAGNDRPSEFSCQCVCHRIGWRLGIFV